MNLLKVLRLRHARLRANLVEHRLVQVRAVELAPVRAMALAQLELAFPARHGGEVKLPDHGLLQLVHPSDPLTTLHLGCRGEPAILEFHHRPADRSRRRRCCRLADQANGIWAPCSGADGGAGESMPPQFGITYSFLSVAGLSVAKMPFPIHSHMASALAGGAIAAEPLVGPAKKKWEACAGNKPNNRRADAPKSGKFADRQLAMTESAPATIFRTNSYGQK
jgi:hypothetical protein